MPEQENSSTFHGLKDKSEKVPTQALFWISNAHF
jgi:hypothetical protein